MEAKNITELTDKERYEYFIEQCIQHKAIWLLQVQEGMYAMFEGDNKKQYIPVWPGQEFADAYATDDWEGYQSERMDLKEFLDWMEELHDDQIFIGVFPGTGMQAIPVEPFLLKTQLIKARKATNQPKL